MSGTAPARTAGRDGAIAFHGVRLTNPDRVLWEDQGLTKRELAEYYLEVADRILPQIVDRPLALVRCPSGAEKGCFFQKHPWAGLDEHVVRETLRHEGGEDEVVVVHDVQGVIGLVQAGVLEIHPWGAALADIERPDRLIFDFDPGEGVPWPEVVAGAREVRDRLREVDIESFPKTTGGKGVHVVVPLTPQAGWAEAKAFARDLAEAVAADSPGRYLAKASKAERKGRIFIDYLRNARGATAVAAYSTRARAGAPVSTPLSWDELSEATGADRFTVASLPARLRALDTDPWADFGRLRQTLPKRPGRKGRG
ncbi:MAG TPA: non-homologous end-joining DNA ligase [Microvirga sp.]|nr:non-homologous end-joining DNA ligase [Microvirga sp.]